MSVELKEKPESKTVSQEEQLTDGFHLLIDALKMNDLNTIYGVPGIPIGYSDYRFRTSGAGQRNPCVVFPARTACG